METKSESEIREGLKPLLLAFKIEKGPTRQERQYSEARKGKKIDSPLVPSEGTQSYHFLILVVSDF